MKAKFLIMEDVVVFEESHHVAGNDVSINLEQMLVRETLLLSYIKLIGSSLNLKLGTTLDYFYTSCYSPVSSDHLNIKR